MDPSQREKVATSKAYGAAGAGMMSFEPINKIHQHLCAFHTYSQDRSRHVEAHHFCTHLSDDLLQCIVYDSEGPKAKLIGIEYVVSEKVFESLPKEEKKYWHSHKYEIESGLLQMQSKSLVPSFVADSSEKPAMTELQKTYGKTIHTWAIDLHPDLPLGPPNLMATYTADGQIPQEMVKARDERLGMSTEHQRELRATYLPAYEKNKDADEWEQTKKGIQFEAKEVQV